MSKCNAKCQVYARVTGYMRPVENWNKGKIAEFKDRLCYRMKQKSRIQMKEQ